MTEIPVQRPVGLEDLFKQKGELVTQLEIAQAKLQLINNQISAFLNQQK